MSNQHLFTDRHRDGYLGETPPTHDCNQFLTPSGRSRYMPSDQTLGAGGFTVEQMECSICGGVTC